MQFESHDFVLSADLAVSFALFLVSSCDAIAAAQMTRHATSLFEHFQVPVSGGFRLVAECRLATVHKLLLHADLVDSRLEGGLHARKTLDVLALIFLIPVNLASD